MDFISNQSDQIEEMLQTIGISNLEQLFESIPKHLRVPAIGIDDGLSEFEGMQLMESLAKKNSFPSFENYLGAGSYEHHIPAIVSAICSKSEFLTAYTPYQAEASQGTLQAIFEFQSAICALTGMDVANASVYDGAAACAEAILMAMRCCKERRKIILSKSLHPHYLEVVLQYIKNHDIEICEIPFEQNGMTDFSLLMKEIDETTAAILVQSPNFFGVVQDFREVALEAKKRGALFILTANPLSYGLYLSAGEIGADIAVGDSQPFGLPLQFGGPYVGYMACKEMWLRQLPGRIVGETVDGQERRGFVLTFQAREQHIRREKATSNICSNQALAALASLIAILWYGKEGVRKLALTNFQKASYLRRELSKIKGVECDERVSIFNEFVLRFEHPIDKVLKHFKQQGIQPGVPLGRFFPEMEQSLLVAVTETKNKEQLDRFVKIAKELE